MEVKIEKNEEIYFDEIYFDEIDFDEIDFEEIDFEEVIKELEDEGNVGNMVKMEEIKCMENIYQRYGYEEIEEWWYYDENGDEICFNLNELKEKELQNLEELMFDENKFFEIITSGHYYVQVVFDKEKKFDNKNLNEKYGFYEITIERENEKYPYYGARYEIYNKEDSSVDILKKIEKEVKSYLLDIVLGFLKKDLINGELE